MRLNRVELRPFKGREFDVLNELWLECDSGEFFLPAGHRTDGASIPLLFRSLLNKGTWTAAAWHDFAYRRGYYYTDPSYVHRYYVSKKSADDLFYLICRYSGVPAWRAWLLWAALRTWNNIKGIFT